MIQKEIREKLTEALKAKDELTSTVLRSLITAFTNELVANKRKPDEEISDEDALKVITRAAKQRKEAVDQYKKGGRDDLAERENAELTVLEQFLPEMMSYEEVEKVVTAKKEELGISDKSQMGQLMGAIMKELKGKADGADVKKAVDQLF